MSDPCASPIAFEQLVDYWAGDLAGAEVDRIDEHLFGCSACTAQSAAIAGIAVALRTSIPPVVSAEQLQQLAAGGLVLEHNTFLPDESKVVRFRPHVDLLIHHLGGLDLARAEHVSVLFRTESSGALLAEDHFVPFDRARGEVLIACQRHFAVMPPDVLFEVHVHLEGGGSSHARFSVPHVFDGAPA